MEILSREVINVKELGPFISQFRDHLTVGDGPTDFGLIENTIKAERVA